MRFTSVMINPGLLAFFAAALLAGCGQNGLGDPTGSTCPPTSTLTYENFGKAFIQNNCLECHTSKQTPHLTTQAEVILVADEIDRAAASGPDTTNTYMPEDGDVADADRKKLGEWLACGAP